VGALLFLSTSTRPDISYVVNKLTQFISAPAEQHWQAAINVLGYLKASSKGGIKLGGINVIGKQSPNITGFSDSDWASDTDDRISVSGGVILWGGSVVSWFSRKQSMIATSTAEAETLAAVEVAYSIMAVKQVISQLLDVEECKVVARLMIDNQPAMDAVKQGKGRNKHYHTKVRFLHECGQMSKFEMQKVSTEVNIADVFTKPLRKVRFRQLLSAIMQFTD
jgi:hypothetical protein